MPGGLPGRGGGGKGGNVEAMNWSTQKDGEDWLGFEVEAFGTDKDNFFDNQKLFNLVINSFILMLFIFDSRKIF